MAIPASAALRQRTRVRRPPATTPHWPGLPGTVYRPRRPTQTALYQAVQHYLETFVTRAAECRPHGLRIAAVGRARLPGLPRVRPSGPGFARTPCEDCGHERLVPFSSTSRGICPSCNARRMCEVAAHLTDHVLPHVPARQMGASGPQAAASLPSPRRARRRYRTPDLPARDSHDAQRSNCGRRALPRPADLPSVRDHRGPAPTRRLRRLPLYGAMALRSPKSAAGRSLPTPGLRRPERSSAPG
jgi:hypothetical protein